MPVGQPEEDVDEDLEPYECVEVPIPYILLAPVHLFQLLALTLEQVEF